MRVIKRLGDWAIYKRTTPVSPLLSSIVLGHQKCSSKIRGPGTTFSKPHHLCIRCGAHIPDEVWRETRFLQRMEEL
jgi:hypothetical protein